MDGNGIIGAGRLAGFGDVGEGVAKGDGRGRIVVLVHRGVVGREGKLAVLRDGLLDGRLVRLSGLLLVDPLIDAMTEVQVRDDVRANDVRSLGLLAVLGTAVARDVLVHRGQLAAADGDHGGEQRDSQKLGVTHGGVLLLLS
ncbi:hypothetical protein D3C72_1745290 [compost metagenome]